MDSIDLSSTHELDTFWRVQASEDLAAGKLYLSPQGIKLIVSGLAEKMEPLKGYISGRDGPLKGYSLDGSELSLVDAFASEPSLYRTKSMCIVSITVFANLCVVGRHLAREDESIPGELWLNFPSLLEWFFLIPHRPGSNGIEAYSVDAELDAQLPILGSRIRSFHSIRETWRYGCSSYDTQVFLYFNADQCNTVQRAVRRAFDCAGLWTVLCGAHVAPSIIFFQEVVEGDERTPGRTHIYVPLGELAYPDKLHPADILLRFETNEEIGAVVDKWLGDERPPKYAVDLFLWAFLQRRRSLCSRDVFQNLVIALEALADSKDIGAPLMDKDAARKLRRDLIKVVNEFAKNLCVEKHVKEALLRRVCDINKGTLREKLAGFLLTMPLSAQTRFSVLKEPLLSKVVATRNCHAHGSDRIKSTAVFNDEELLQVTDQLQLLVLLLLLKDVGCEANMIMTRMLDRWDFRHILESRLSG